MQANYNKLIKVFINFFILCFLITDGLLSQTLPISKNLINLNSDEGEELLFSSEEREDFLPLSSQFVTQENLAYCGVASMVMILNALKIPAPETSQFRNYRVFTQKNFFNNSNTQKVLTADAVSRGGMTLEQLGKLLNSYPVEAKIYHAQESNLSEFRQLVIKNLQEPNNFILVNYLRSKINQETGGHISPIAAYNKKSDRFLILDVARYKYPPVWVKAEELWQAMNTIDKDSGKTRGFVLINTP